MSKPKMRTSPSSASTNDERIRIRVDFPDPLAPISPKMLRGAISKETSCTARTRRGGFLDHGERKPGVKVLDTCRTTSGRGRSSRETERRGMAVLRQFVNSGAEAERPRNDGSRQGP